MLLELEVRDFAVIEHVTLRLSPGFNVLTGETGAGKSILVDAVGQLIGERSDSALVRTGCDRALIRGVFEPGAAREHLAQVLAAHGVDDELPLIVTREVTSAGRSTARVNGSIVTVRALGEIGRLLVDVHGQSENASLKRPAEHVELLDRYAGLSEERRTMSELVARLRRIESEIDELREDEEALRRRADLLAYQVSEVTDAGLSVTEEADLVAERTRLANAEKLAQWADAAYRALRDDEGETSAALEHLERAVSAVDALTRIDTTLADLHVSLRSALETLSDRASELRAYRDRLAFDPVRMDEVEGRLALYSDLKRKHGPDVPAVLAFAERAAAELSRITDAGDRLQQLESERQDVRSKAGATASVLSSRRRKAGAQLSRAVEGELDEIGMAGSRFEVEFEGHEDPSGIAVDGTVYAYDATGVDRVSFLVSTNPGEDMRPLVRVSSGGETARLMLALKTILTAADRVPSLIFDEIDAGLGGRVGAVVGRKLWGVAARHQVLCVTHLPQVAVYGDMHLHVRKRVVDGRTVTEVAGIDGSERVDELSSMLGSRSAASRENADQLLLLATEWKAARLPDAVPGV